MIGGKGNYNVCCPLTDHLVGTFVPEREWRPRARSTYASWHGEELSIEQQIKCRLGVCFFKLRRRRRRDAAPPRRSFATVSVPHRNHIARESFGLGEVQIAPGAKKGDGGGASGWVEKAEVVLA